MASERAQLLDPNAQPPERVAQRGSEERAGTDGMPCLPKWLMPETRVRNSKWLAPLKWIGPMFCAGFFQVIVMLIFGRIATYLYVQEMLYEAENRPLQKNASNPPFETSANYHRLNVSYNSLNDPVQGWLGWQQVPLTALDALAAIFPACFVFLAVYKDELRIWTHIMLSNVLLAFGKGIFEIMTIIPDSIGWRDCQIRLGDEGVNWHTKKRSVWELVLFEVAKYFGGPKVRYCADMLWSGHTYVVTLYALGLFEICRRQTRHWTGKTCIGKYRCLALWAIGSIAVIQQAVEIYFILKNRFHYTIDVAMAVLMTFLVYSNGAVAASAKMWVRWQEDERSAHFASDEYVILKVKLSELESDGEVIIPPCCLPFCTCEGQEHIFSDEDMVRIADEYLDFKDLRPESQTMEDMKEFIKRRENGDPEQIELFHRSMLFDVLDNMGIPSDSINEAFSHGKQNFSGDTSRQNKRHRLAGGKNA